MRRCRTNRSGGLGDKRIRKGNELKETSNYLSNLIQKRKDLKTNFEKETEAILTNVSTIKNNIIKHLIKIEGKVQDKIIALKKKQI